MVKVVCIALVLSCLFWGNSADDSICYKCLRTANCHDVVDQACMSQEKCFAISSSLDMDSYSLGCKHDGLCVSGTTAASRSAVERFVANHKTCSECCSVDACSVYYNLCSTGSANDCSEYLISGPNGISTESLTNSSHYLNPNSPDDCLTKYSRLNSSIGWAWCATWPLDPNQWIQARFSVPRTVRGIAIGGRDNQYTQYVKEFRVSYSNDCITYQTISNSDGTAMNFIGNNDTSTIVINMLPTPVTAVCVRLNPTQWNNYISLRWDIIGC